MTQEGRIPDHIANQIETNRSRTSGYCERCNRQCRIKVEHPEKNGKMICEECEIDILCKQSNVDLDELPDMPEEFEL